MCNILEGLDKAIGEIFRFRNDVARIALSEESINGNAGGVKTLFAGPETPKGAADSGSGAEKAQKGVGRHEQTVYRMPHDDLGGRPLLILTGEQVQRDYLAYLDSRRTSWIACGRESIDLRRACAILAEQLGVKRMAVVGGGHITWAFWRRGCWMRSACLSARGLTAAAAWRRCLTDSRRSVRPYESGAVWLRYRVGRE